VKVPERKRERQRGRETVGPYLRVHAHNEPALPERRVASRRVVLVVVHLVLRLLALRNVPNHAGRSSRPREHASVVVVRIAEPRKVPAPSQNANRQRATVTVTVTESDSEIESDSGSFLRISENSSRTGCKIYPPFPMQAPPSGFVMTRLLKNFDP
jgi:hypothetical protein